jgi:hypothetical protein
VIPRGILAPRFQKKNIVLFITLLDAPLSSNFNQPFGMLNIGEKGL